VAEGGISQKTLNSYAAPPGLVTLNVSLTHGLRTWANKNSARSGLA